MAVGDEPPRPGASRELEQARGRLQLQGWRTKTELRGRGAGPRSQRGWRCGRDKEQIERLNVVSCDPVLVLIGLGSFRPQKEGQLAQRELFVGRFRQCRAGWRSVSLCPVGLLGKTAGSQSAAGRSVGERLGSRAVKKLRNSASDMTEAEGVERKRCG